MQLRGRWYVSSLIIAMCLSAPLVSYLGLYLIGPEIAGPAAYSRQLKYGSPRFFLPLVWTESRLRGFTVILMRRIGQDITLIQCCPGEATQHYEAVVKKKNEDPQAGRTTK